MCKNLSNINFVFVKRISVFFIFFYVYSCFCQKNEFFDDFFLKKIENRAFMGGELLKYKISYGKQSKKRGVLTAGHATLNVENINNELYQLNAFGETTRLFSLFMNVKHTYQSIVHKSTLRAIEFKMSIQEGSHFIFDSIIFNNTLALEEKSYNDILSIFYKLRCLHDVETLNADTLFFSYYYNGHIFNSYALNLGKDTVKTKFGELETIKLAPLLEKGRVFRSTMGAFVWVTADPMHIPVKIEFPILVGSIYVNLISYKKTLHDLNQGLK